MNVGSLFSGIGGMDLGLARAGFRHAFFCESDAWRRTVLAHHWPGVPIYEDVCDVAYEDERGGRGHLAGAGLQPGASGSDESDGERSGRGIGLLCGGFPCQDVSVAGRRAGLAGARSGLFHEFARIAESLRPRWLLVENVPGLLSSNGGRDFGVVLGTLADIGYGVGWRIVDSRFFGVPQRRRRVFIVGALADGGTRAAAERAGEILAVGTRCPGHPATGAEARENAAVASLSGLGSGGPDDNDGQGGRLVSHALTSEGHDASEDGTGRGTPMTAYALRSDPGGTGQGHNVTYVAAPLSHGSSPNSNMAGRRREDDENLVAFQHTQGIDIQASSENFPTLRREGGGAAIMLGGSQQDSFSERDGIAPTLAFSSGTHQGHHQPKLLDGAAVRRLTPTECERLQALPDGWTDFGPDSRRYAALGDAVTASVSEWIGRRLIAHGF